MPFRKDRKEKDPAEENDIYRLKKIRYGALTGIPICLQNKNGPCPLLAIANALLLRGEIHIHPDLSYVKEEQLIEKLIEYVYTVNKRQLNAATSTNSEEIIINNQANLAEVVSLLPQLKRGIDVNVRYGPSPESFEFTREVACFDVFRTRLVHGWLVDPADNNLYQAVGNRSFNQIMDILIMADVKCSPAGKTSSQSFESSTRPEQAKEEEKESEDSFKDARSRADEGCTSGISGADDKCAEDDARPNVPAFSGQTEERVPHLDDGQVGLETTTMGSKMSETGTGDYGEEQSSTADASRVELNQERPVRSTEQSKALSEETDFWVPGESKSTALQYAERHHGDSQGEQLECLPREERISIPNGNEGVSRQHEECDEEACEMRKTTPAEGGKGVFPPSFESSDSVKITHEKDASEEEESHKRAVKENVSGNIPTVDKGSIKHDNAEEMVDEARDPTDMTGGGNGAQAEKEDEKSVLGKENAEISEDTTVSGTWAQDLSEQRENNTTGGIKRSKAEDIVDEVKDPVGISGGRDGANTEKEYGGNALEKGETEISEDVTPSKTMVQTSNGKEKNVGQLTQLESSEGLKSTSLPKNVPDEARDQESDAMRGEEKSERFCQEQLSSRDGKQVGGKQGKAVAMPSSTELRKDDGKDMNGPQNLPTRRKSESEAILQAAHIQEFLQQYPSQLTYYGLAQLRQCIRPDELCVLFRNNHFSTITRRGNDLYVLVSDLGYLHETDIVWEKLNDLSGNTEFVNGNFVSFSPHSPGLPSGVSKAPAQPAPSAPPVTGAHFESDEAYAAYLSRVERENLDAAYALRLQEEEQRVASASVNDAELAKRLQAAENNRTQQADTSGQRQHGQVHRVARPSSRLRRSRAASSGNRSSRTRTSSSAGSELCSIQ